jgi:hypothetical protein
MSKGGFPNCIERPNGADVTGISAGEMVEVVLM